MKAGVPKSPTEVKDLMRLREIFLTASEQPGVADYWMNSSLLELYDNTFARRIGWKWDAVVRELEHKEWQPKPHLKRWIDWGCGSGVASEIFLGQFQSALPQRLVLSDRSSHARDFSSKKIKRLHPGLEVESVHPKDLSFTKDDLVLISHVTNELSEADFQKLTGQIANASTIVWVEPGTPFCSRRLVALRESLSAQFSILAPCPHQKTCGLLNESRDWCHFFAAPPSGIFQNSEFLAFAKELQIDLRSLPVSFIVLERKEAVSEALSTPPAAHQRMIGRPRFYKGHAKLLLCESEGIHEKSLQERHHKKDFKLWERDSFCVEFTNGQDSD